MPLLRINATPDGLVLNDTPQSAARRLCSMASRSGPAIIMVHGYKYRPGSASHCPHAKIFGLKANNWPAQLRFGQDDKNEGIGIALGWDAQGPLRTVHRRATGLGESLAVIVAMLRHHAPRRPVHVIAHSLGAELALSALAHLPAGAINRMILLTGASYAHSAAICLDTPAGRSLQLLNITSRENDLFDAAFERLVPSNTAHDRAIGCGIDAPNVTTLQMDCAVTLKALNGLGFDIAPPNRRICHWSAYTRPGAMALYAQVLRGTSSLSFEQLVKVLPRVAAPRWSRLLPRGSYAGEAPDIPLLLQSGALSLRAHTMNDTPRRRRRNEPAY